MGSKEDAGKRCPAAGGVSSFTIQSILGGGPSEAPREPAGWPARKRSLSVSSEEEEPDDGWKAPACCCPDPHGPQEPGPQHHPPIPFPCLGKDRGRPAGRQRALGEGNGALASGPAGQSRGRRVPGPRAGDARGVLPRGPRGLGRRPGHRPCAVWSREGWVAGEGAAAGRAPSRAQCSALNSPKRVGHFASTRSERASAARSSPAVSVPPSSHGLRLSLSALPRPGAPRDD
uniref:H6 family homeobox 2 n=1 Tax=Myotis myotis TaxID=51298 RepID=A0A7J7TT98_MYOMY|nr:H6 family homeobox 2 [Myotis myotis]